jgi:outer membrane protein OmpA-like peptidoglycan-associated protein
MKRWAFLSMLVLAGVGAVGCFATRDFVLQEVGKIDTQVARHDSELEQERGRVADLRTQLAATRSRADEAGRRAEYAVTVGTDALGSASDARMRAREALARAQDAEARLQSASARRNRREVAVVRFAPNRADLNERAQASLMNVVRVLDGNPNAAVAVLGYADPTGRPEQNLQLSQRRAEAVRRFMVQHGADVLRIQSIGMGVVRPSTRGRPPEDGRRAAVHLIMPAQQDISGAAVTDASRVDTAVPRRPRAAAID